MRDLLRLWPLLFFVGFWVLFYVLGLLGLPGGIDGFFPFLQLSLIVVVALIIVWERRRKRRREPKRRPLRGLVEAELDARSNGTRAGE